MTEVVLDASVAVTALAGGSAEARALRSRLDGTVCHAPHLVDAEVGSVLRRRTASGDLTRSLAEAALRGVSALIDERYPHGPLSAAAWGLRNNVSYYDALYVALAARLGVPLLTADARLARAPGLPCDVEVIS